MEFIKGLSNYIMCMNNFKKDFTNRTIFFMLPDYTGCRETCHNKSYFKIFELKTE